MATGPRPELFTLRRRPLGEKLLDQGFHRLTIVLASLVGLLLLGILFTVLGGAREAFARFGLSFLTTSNWDPVGEQYGAFTAIYGTLATSLAALLIAVPLGVGTAIFLTETIIPLRIRQVLAVMVE
ncbi:MAG: phosphate transporter permease subunit PstC, partial [Cyanobacteriota bacterium]